MAHKIDFSKGFNAFVSFAAPAWHGLGEVMNDAVSTQDALIRGGLDFDVIKFPNVHYLPNGEERVSEKSFFTFRTDTNGILGDRLGCDYTVLQNAEALNVADEILQSGTATIETAGAIDEGRKVFICLKVNNPIVVNGNDTVNQYLLITNSHDGSMSVTAMFTNIRVVCNNTLTAALRQSGGQKVKIRHTATASARLQEAAKVMGMIKRNSDENTEAYSRMQEQVISREQMFDYFGNVFFTRDEIKEIKEGRNVRRVLSTQKQNVLAKVLDFANTGVGQSMAMRGNDHTLWSAYNAVTGYLTRKQYNSVNDRANAMMFGGVATLIEEAGVLAANPSKIVTLRQSLGGVNWN